MNPYSPPKSSAKMRRTSVHFWLVIVIYISAWPVLALAIQTVEVLAEILLGLQRGRISRFVTRNLAFQLSYLGIGSVACLLAALNERNRSEKKSTSRLILSTLLGVFVVCVEIVIFHPPSAK